MSWSIQGKIETILITDFPGKSVLEETILSTLMKMHMRMETNVMYALRKTYRRSKAGYREEGRGRNKKTKKRKYSIVKVLDTIYLNSNPGFILDLL